MNERIEIQQEDTGFKVTADRSGEASWERVEVIYDWNRGIVTVNVDGKQMKEVRLEREQGIELHL